MSAQELPKSHRLEQPLDDGKTEYFLGGGYEVCSWRPGPPESGPVTQVHLLMDIAPGVKTVLRMKSARALDELVGLLIQYRNEVWPGGGSKS